MSFVHDNDVALMYQHVVALPQGFGKTRLAMDMLNSEYNKRPTFIVHSSAKGFVPQGAQVIVMDEMPVMPKLTPRPSFGDIFLDLLAKERRRNFEECQRIFGATLVESRVSLFVKNQMGIVPNVPFSE